MNKVFYNIMLMAFVLITYCFYLNHSNNSLTVDSIKINSLTSCSVFDSEIQEEEPFVSKAEFYTEAITHIQTVNFPVTCRFSQPDFAIWQPPKIS